MLSGEKKTAVGAFISPHQFKTTIKIKFKIQLYQSDTMESTVLVFAGQPSHDAFQFRRDLGKKADGRIIFEEEYTGYRNSDIELNDKLPLRWTHRLCLRPSEKHHLLILTS